MIEANIPMMHDAIGQKIVVWREINDGGEGIFHRCSGTVLKYDYISGSEDEEGYVIKWENSQDGVIDLLPYLCEADYIEGVDTCRDSNVSAYFEYRDKQMKLHTGEIIQFNSLTNMSTIQWDNNKQQSYDLQTLEKLQYEVEDKKVFKYEDIHNILREETLESNFQPIRDGVYAFLV